MSPLESLRWRAMILSAGRLRVGFSLAMAGSFHVVNLALVDVREHLAGQLDVGPVEPGDVVVDLLSRDGQGNVQEAGVLGDLGARQVGVRRTDIDDAVGGIRNAGSGAGARRDHLYVGVLLVISGRP